MILGIDASSSCVGWCLLVENGNYIDIGHLDLKKEKSLYKKLNMFETILTAFIKLYPECQFKIFIEAPLQRSNNQFVVNLLQRWNGMICTSLYRRFHEEPTLIEQRTALKAIGLTVPKGTKGLDRKKYILKYVQDLGIIPDERWELKKTGNPKDFCYDQADAYVIALAGTKT